MANAEQPESTSRLGSMLPALAWLIYALTVPVRAWYVFSWHDPNRFVFSDMLSYLSNAALYYDPTYRQTIADTIYPPGAAYWFGFLLKFSGHSTTAITISLFLGSCLIPVLVYAIGRRLYSRRTALAALVLASLYFHFMAYAGYYLTETPYTVCVLLAMWLLIIAVQSEDPLASMTSSPLAGLAVGASAALKNAALAPFLLVLMYLGVLFAVRRRLASFASLAVIVVGGTVLVLSPLAIRATRLMDGQFCLTSVTAEMDILMGHSGRTASVRWEDDRRGFYYEFGFPVALQKGYEERRVVKFGPYDRAANVAMAWDWIKQHPGEAFIQSFEHVYDYFTGTIPWPSSHGPERTWMVLAERLYTFFWLVPAMALVLRLVPTWWRREDGYWGDLLLVMPTLAMAAVAFAFSGEPRYRVPFDGFTCLLAARFYLSWSSSGVEPGRSLVPGHDAPAAGATVHDGTSLAEPADGHASDRA